MRGRQDGDAAGAQVAARAQVSAAVAVRVHLRVRVNTVALLLSFIQASNSQSGKIGLAFRGVNVVCEVPFYFVCICQTCYIINEMKNKIT